MTDILTCVTELPPPGGNHPAADAEPAASASLATVEPPPLWTDENELATDWPLPQTTSPKRRWLLIGIPVLVLAVLIAGTWIAGGFEKANNISYRKEPGDLLEIGPYEFRFTHVTAQHIGIPVTHVDSGP